MSQESLIRFKKANGEEVVGSADTAGNLNVTLNTLISGEDTTNDVLKVEERFSFTNITTGADTEVKTGAGFLHSIQINNPGSSWEIDVYDGTSTSGTLIGKIRGTTVPTTLKFDVSFSTGLTIDTVKGTTVGDITVAWR